MFQVALDLSALDCVIDLDDIVGQEAAKAQRNLARAAQAHIAEQAHRRLHTRLKMYLDGISLKEDNGDIIITLDAKVRWIEDGMRPHSMLESLLGSDKARTSKDGNKYLIVPFQLNKKPSQLTPAQQTLLATVTKSLASIGRETGESLTPSKIENNADGSPKLGLIRKMDIMGGPLKLSSGPGMGHGAIGDVRQGPTGIPFLQGVRVYQNKMKGQDGAEKVQRSIMTFRVASEKHLDQGNRWNHPGLQAMNFFEETARWAQNEVDSHLAPALMNQILVQLGG